jgi:hypothetical protein
MARIAEEMKQWSAMLGEELHRLPQVTSRPMFGLLGFYRKGKIFAALPVTRAIGTANSIIFKIQPMPVELAKRAAADPRVNSETKRAAAKWTIFELRSEKDISDALSWLGQAYERAK